MNTIQATKHYTDDYARDNFAARLLTDDDYDLVVRDDTVVLKPDGSPLLIYRKGVIPFEYCDAAYSNFRTAALSGDSSNRGMAAGKGRYVGAEGIGEHSATRFRPVKKDGTLSNSTYSLKGRRAGSLIEEAGGVFEMQHTDQSWRAASPDNVPSGVVGFMDKSARFPYCRLTAFNVNHPDMFAASLPFISAVDRVFSEAIPERYQAQRAIVESTTPEFYITGTVFTTVTVNLNFVTAIHTDVGDLRAGFGVMSTLRGGAYEGCYTCFPQWRIAADMQTGDVLLADVHEWHGNTPLHPKGAYERLACVFYYREKIQNCGTFEEELRNAQRNRGLTHLPDWEKQDDV